jgi:hypothetical protein
VVVLDRVFLAGKNKIAHASIVLGTVTCAGKNKIAHALNWPCHP